MRHGTKIRSLFFVGILIFLFGIAPILKNIEPVAGYIPDIIATGTLHDVLIAVLGIIAVAIVLSRETYSPYT